MIGGKVIIALVLLGGCFAIPAEDSDAKTKPDSEIKETKSKHLHKLLKYEGAIVNGTEVKEGGHPHMVALTTGPPPLEYLCGASLITTRTVLTAAHCIEAVYFDGALYSELGATVGTVQWGVGGTTYPIVRNVTHPHFVLDLLLNDIGLLFTKDEVVLTNLVKTVQLSFDEIPKSVQTIVAGWGSISTNDTSVVPLMEVDLMTVGGDRCVEVVNQASKDLKVEIRAVQPQLELCTYRSVGVGTCCGDSGSALLRVSDKRQIGVVSWGFPCARGAPDMFARLSHYKEWIEKHTEPALLSN